MEPKIDPQTLEILRLKTNKEAILEQIAQSQVHKEHP